MQIFIYYLNGKERKFHGIYYIDFNFKLLDLIKLIILSK